MVWPGGKARIHKGDRRYLARGARRPRPGRGFDVRITAVRKLAVEAADNGLLAPEIAAGITRVKGVASKGVRLGNWLSVKQAQAPAGLLDLRDATKFTPALPLRRGA